MGCVSTRDRLNGYVCTRIGAATRAYVVNFANPIKWQKQAIFDCQGGNMIACIGAPAVIPMMTFVGVAMAPLMIPIGMANDDIYRDGCPQTSAGTPGSNPQQGRAESLVRPSRFSAFTYDDPYVLGQRAFDNGRDESALEFWKPLAESGDCDSQTKLGILYFLGAGAPQSYEAAQSWWTKGSQQGHPLAYALLANMYGHDQITVGTSRRSVVLDCSKGCGVEQNLVQYYKWYNLVKENPHVDVFPRGREEALRILAILRGDAPTESKFEEPARWRLTPAQIVEGDRLTSEYRLALPQCVPQMKVY
jgi:hypothetical protein